MFLCLLPLLVSVKKNSYNDDCALDDVLPVGGYAEQIQAIADDGNDERADHSAGDAAGAACNQRRELRGKLRPEHEAAGALRAVEAFALSKPLC